MIKSEYFPLSGGLNLVDPPITMPPGNALLAENYEANVRGGYSRIEGFERFDGQPKPSEQLYYCIPVTGLVEVAAGTTVYGQTSGATAQVVATDGDCLMVTKITGTFASGESLDTTAGPYYLDVMISINEAGV